MVRRLQCMAIAFLLMALGAWQIISIHKVSFLDDNNSNKNEMLMLPQRHTRNKISNAKITTNNNNNNHSLTTIITRNDDGDVFKNNYHVRPTVRHEDRISAPIIVGTRNQTGFALRLTKSNNIKMKTRYYTGNLDSSSNGSNSVPSHDVRRRRQPDVETNHPHHPVLLDNNKDISTIPGAFANNTLYFQTIRWTTSYQPSVHDVHVDLFGFSGQATRFYNATQWDPYCSNVPDRFNETLLGREAWEGKHANDRTLYCQVDIKKRNRNQSSSSRLVVPNNLIKMTYIPMNSVDFVISTGSLHWRCNVTDMINKPQLIQYMDDAYEHRHTNGSQVMTLPVHIWIRYKKNNNKKRAKTKNSAIKLATFHIPLNTGSLGVGTPIISDNRRHQDHNGMVTSKSSYFLHQQPPVTAGLCVAIYGMKPLRYIRQFVQHHLNVGFGSVFVGVKGPADGPELHQTKALLQRYMDQGVVELTHYDSPFTCHQVHGTEVDQMQFYQPCLYHYKGLTKYVAIWDMDEFWTPPNSVHVDGRHNYSYFSMGIDDEVMMLAPNNNNNTTATITGLIRNVSSWSTFSRTVQSDPLWQQSHYAQSVSIRDTLDAIERYYHEHECESSFCFHLFPFRVVFRRNHATSDESRTQRIGQDFELRKVAYDNIWHKSIANTNYAHMCGLHTAGSCLFQKSLDVVHIPSRQLDTYFHPFSNVEACNPRRFEHHVYGSMHHFFDLLSTSRWPMGSETNDNVTQLDEYVSLYATTVDLQLERDDRLQSISGEGSPNL